MGEVALIAGQAATEIAVGGAGFGNAVFHDAPQMGQHGGGVGDRGRARYRARLDIFLVRKARCKTRVMLDKDLVAVGREGVDLGGGSL